MRKRSNRLKLKHNKTDNTVRLRTSSLTATDYKHGDIVKTMLPLPWGHQSVPAGTRGRVIGNIQHGRRYVSWEKIQWGQKLDQVHTYPKMDSPNANVPVSGANLPYIRLVSKRGRTLRPDEYIDNKNRVRRIPASRMGATGNVCPKCKSPTTQSGYSQGYGSQSSYHTNTKCTNTSCDWRTHDVYD